MSNIHATKVIEAMQRVQETTHRERNISMKTVKDFYMELRKEFPHYKASNAFSHAKGLFRMAKLERRCDLKIEVLAEVDDLDFRGDVYETGDADLDERIENEIVGRLERGDVWAWAIVEVRVTKTVCVCDKCGREETLTASDYLGGCSYADERDFRRNSFYYFDMVDDCLERIEANN